MGKAIDPVNSLAVWRRELAASGEIVLGIETSCDETAAAIVCRHADGRGTILSNIVRSQWEHHRPYGGVVPEIAARAHVECLDALVRQALQDADLEFSDLSAVAAAAGPGLVGGLMVGLSTAKAIAIVHNLPFLAINHLEAHALTVGLTDAIGPPYLLLLVSGGHTQLIAVEGIGRYRRLGTTIDDALGEAFDKTAKLLGLGLPGGPNVEKWARGGDPHRFAFPRPLIGRHDLNFSFAGLKTAVRQQATALAPLTDRDIADLCASFQEAVVATLVDRCRRALRVTADNSHVRLVIAGGVAANQRLRSALEELTRAEGASLHVAPPGLCTDNAAMIAWAAAEHLAAGRPSDDLGVAPKARWPLDPAATPLLGSGRLGPKV